MVTSPNRVMFNSVDWSLSSLSKDTNLFNFSLQFIVQFDQNLKIYQEISVILCGFDPYLIQDISRYIEI